MDDKFFNEKSKKKNFLVSKKKIVMIICLTNRVAILTYVKIAKFASEKSQNSQVIFKNSHKLATFYTHFTTLKNKNLKINSQV